MTFGAEGGQCITVDVDGCLKNLRSAPVGNCEKHYLGALSYPCAQSLQVVDFHTIIQDESVWFRAVNYWIPDVSSEILI